MDSRGSVRPEPAGAPKRAWRVVTIVKGGPKQLHLPDAKRRRITIINAMRYKKWEGTCYWAVPATVDGDENGFSGHPVDATNFDLRAHTAKRDPDIRSAIDSHPSGIEGGSAISCDQSNLDTASRQMPTGDSTEPRCDTEMPPFSKLSILSRASGPLCAERPQSSRPSKAPNSSPGTLVPPERSPFVRCCCLYSKREFQATSSSNQVRSETFSDVKPFELRVPTCSLKSEREEAFDELDEDACGPSRSSLLKPRQRTSLHSDLLKCSELNPVWHLGASQTSAWLPSRAQIKLKNRGPTEPVIECEDSTSNFAVRNKDSTSSKQTHAKRKSPCKLRRGGRSFRPLRFIVYRPHIVNWLRRRNKTSRNLASVVKRSRGHEPVNQTMKSASKTVETLQDSDHLRISKSSAAVRMETARDRLGMQKQSGGRSPKSSDINRTGKERRSAPVNHARLGTFLVHSHNYTCQAVVGKATPRDGVFVTACSTAMLPSTSSGQGNDQCSGSDTNDMCPATRPVSPPGRGLAASTARPGDADDERAEARSSESHVGVRDRAHESRDERRPIQPKDELVGCLDVRQTRRGRNDSRTREEVSSWQCAMGALCGKLKTREERASPPNTTTHSPLLSAAITTAVDHDKAEELAETGVKESCAPADGSAQPVKDDEVSRTYKSESKPSSSKEAPHRALVECLLNSRKSPLKQDSKSTKERNIARRKYFKASKTVSVEPVPLSSKSAGFLYGEVVIPARLASDPESHQGNVGQMTAKSCNRPTTVEDCTLTPTLIEDETCASSNAELGTNKDVSLPAESPRRPRTARGKVHRTGDLISRVSCNGPAETGAASINKKSDVGDKRVAEVQASVLRSRRGPSRRDYRISNHDEHKITEHETTTLDNKPTQLRSLVRLSKQQCLSTLTGQAARRVGKSFLDESGDSHQYITRLESSSVTSSTRNSPCEMTGSGPMKRRNANGKLSSDLEDVEEPTSSLPLTKRGRNPKRLRATKHLERLPDEPEKAGSFQSCASPIQAQKRPGKLAQGNSTHGQLGDASVLPEMCAEQCPRHELSAMEKPVDWIRVLPSKAPPVERSSPLTIGVVLPDQVAQHREVMPSRSTTTTGTGPARESPPLNKPRTRRAIEHLRTALLTDHSPHLGNLTDAVNVETGTTRRLTKDDDADTSTAQSALAIAASGSGRRTQEPPKRPRNGQQKQPSKGRNTSGGDTAIRPKAKLQSLADDTRRSVQQPLQSIGQRKSTSQSSQVTSGQQTRQARSEAIVENVNTLNTDGRLGLGTSAECTPAPRRTRRAATDKQEPTKRLSQRLEKDRGANRRKTAGQCFRPEPTDDGQRPPNTTSGEAVMQAVPNDRQPSTSGAPAAAGVTGLGANASEADANSAPTAVLIPAAQGRIDKIISEHDFTTWDDFVEMAAKVVYLSKKLKTNPAFPDRLRRGKYYSRLVNGDFR